MRIFFSVGEPSGDLHGSNLIRHMKSQDPNFEFVGFGGPKMAEAGCQLHFELTSMAVMFLREVFKNIRLFFRLIGEANTYFANHQVDAVVLIDYPGFNWWIARKAKKHGIPVFYYGTPQMWASAPWRVRKIRKFVDHVLCKLPFEVDWFEKRNCHATYVGHPYFDQIAGQKYDDDFISELADGGRQILTLLPGSRDLEVRNILPVLLKVAEQTLEQTENCRVIIAFYNQRQQDMAADMLDAAKFPIEAFVGKTPELMKAAHVCVACSGSVSMELLHHRKPTVIVYKVNRWIMLAQSVWLHSKFITLVNLIAASDIRKRTWGPFDPDAENAEPCVMPEYLSCGDPSEKVTRRVVRWMKDKELYGQNVAELDSLAAKYAIPGASQRAADYILDQMRVEVGKTDSPQQLQSDNRQVSSNERSAA